MNWGLKEETIAQVTDVLAQHPEVEQAILYGSRAKGNFKNGSDVDLTLKGQHLNQPTVWEIRGKLDDLSTPYTFDISFFDDISNQELIDHINRVGVMFYNASDNT